MRAHRSLCLSGLSVAAGLLLAVQTCWAQAAVETQVRIVSASYGAPRSTRAQDFSKRLEQTCGDHSVSCQSFCSAAFTGLTPRLRIPFSAPPVCRVIYRCGEGHTRATETEDGDMIALSCKPER
jgi:hypothetical protein